MLSARKKKSAFIKKISNYLERNSILKFFVHCLTDCFTAIASFKMRTLQNKLVAWSPRSWLISSKNRENVYWSKILKQVFWWKIKKQKTSLTNSRTQLMKTKLMSSCSSRVWTIQLCCSGDHGKFKMENANGLLFSS